MRTNLRQEIYQGYAAQCEANRVVELLATRLQDHLPDSDDLRHWSRSILACIRQSRFDGYIVFFELTNPELTESEWEETVVIEEFLGVSLSNHVEIHRQDCLIYCTASNSMELVDRWSLCIAFKESMRLLDE